MWHSVFGVGVNLVQVLRSDNVEPPHVLCKGQVSLMKVNIVGMHLSTNGFFYDKCSTRELSSIIIFCYFWSTTKRTVIIGRLGGKENGDERVGRQWDSRTIGIQLEWWILSQLSIARGENHGEDIIDVRGIKGSLLRMSVLRR